MKFLKRIWSNFLSYTIAGISKSIGMLSDHWAIKHTCYLDVLVLENILQEGDVILTRTNGHMSTLIIPGFWKHAAVFLGKTGTVDGHNMVIEAVAPRVRMAYLNDLIQKTDYFCVKRLKIITPQQRSKVAVESKKFLDKRYDFKQRLNRQDRVSCSELVFHSVNDALFDGAHYLKPIVRLGYDCYAPNDIDKDEKWITIFERKK